jgi:hypothetical protein
MSKSDLQQPEKDSEPWEAEENHIPSAILQFITEP